MALKKEVEWITKLDNEERTVFFKHLLNNLELLMSEYIKNNQNNEKLTTKLNKTRDIIEIKDTKEILETIKQIITEYNSLIKNNNEERLTNLITIISLLLIGIIATTAIPNKENISLPPALELALITTVSFIIQKYISNIINREKERVLATGIKQETPNHEPIDFNKFIRSNVWEFSGSSYGK